MTTTAYRSGAGYYSWWCTSCESGGHEYSSLDDAQSGADQHALACEAGQ